MAIEIQTFYDRRSGTATHVAFSTTSLVCAIIDPVFDLDPKSGRTNHAPIDSVVGFIRDRGLTLEWILETHIHHDHVSGAFAIREALGGRIAIGSHVHEVAGIVREVYGLGALMNLPFDQLLKEGDQLPLGDEAIEVWATPGHTIDHLSYRIKDAIFVGDTLFMPDSGTARCDFHRANAHHLYASIKRILEEPDDVRLFICHDYGAEGTREPAWETTVGAQRATNIHVGGGRSERDFVALRKGRDADLDMPALLLACLPLNIEAGRLPAPASNGRVILRFPLNVSKDAL